MSEDTSLEQCEEPKAIPPIQRYDGPANGPTMAPLTPEQSKTVIIQTLASLLADYKLQSHPFGPALAPEAEAVFSEVRAFVGSKLKEYL